MPSQHSSDYFPELRLKFLFHLIDYPNPKDIEFTIIKHIIAAIFFTFEKLKQANVLFCFIFCYLYIFGRPLIKDLVLTH